MKSVLITAAFFAVAALAQIDLGALNSLPACGKVCITNMLALAPSLGCGATDVACLCKNDRFRWGIRDCTNESCPENVRSQVISAGTAYCNDAVASASKAGSTGSGTATGGAGASGSGSSSGSGSGSATGGGAGGSRTPVTTKPLVSTITTGSGAPITTTVGSTTLFSVIGGAAGSGASSATGAAGSAASSATGAAGSAASSASGAAGSAASSASGAVSSALSSASGAVSSASAAGSSAGSSAAGGATSSSSGLAPVATMAAQGVLGAAGLAAVLLL